MQCAAGRRWGWGHTVGTGRTATALGGPSDAAASEYTVSSINFFATIYHGSTVYSNTYSLLYSGNTDVVPHGMYV